jgi:hypothetical protein
MVLVLVVICAVLACSLLIVVAAAFFTSGCADPGSPLQRIPWLCSFAETARALLSS